MPVTLSVVFLIDRQTILRCYFKRI